MKNSRAKDRLIDLLLILMMIVPFGLAMTLKILTTPASEGISISGAQIYFTVPMPIQDWPVTESQVVSLCVIIAIFGLCLFMTRNLKVVPTTKRQIVVEFVVEAASNFVEGNMGKRFLSFGPFVAAIMALSAFSSLSSLLGLYPPTSDINVTAGWAILVFFLITYYKLKCGVGKYLKSL